MATRLPQLETINRSQTTNQPCSLRCLSLGGIHVSTGQWKHVRWPVETFPQASGRADALLFSFIISDIP